MITNEQITQLDNLLGKCLRLAISIECTINSIYFVKAPMKQPVFYTNENIDLCANSKYNEECKELLDLNFINSLKGLQKLDTKNEIFSIKQYDTLHQIRKERNSITHEMWCEYITLNYNKEQIKKDYDRDIKKLKRFISLAQQYDALTKKVFSKVNKLDDINVWDTIRIVGVTHYKF